MLSAQTPSSLPVLIHNDELEPYVKSSYTPDDVKAIWSLLDKHNSLKFRTVEGRGLFKAAETSVAEGETAEDTGYTGYDNIWVRDNIHIAHAHVLMNKHSVAVAALNDIVAFWQKYRIRWEDCIKGVADYNGDVQERPHIRFNGTELKENEVRWSHAQNDAIGYFVWLYSKLAREGKIEKVDADMLALIVLYHKKIEFWQDEDSGHWEEVRKVAASSIGCATAGYRELAALLADNKAVSEAFEEHYKENVAKLHGKDAPLPAVGAQLVAELQKKGFEAMSEILPVESKTKGAERPTDGALLFLVYPLAVTTPEQTNQILKSVTGQLAGDYGIRRYLGDSYWMADYKTIFSAETRTADFSDDMGSRDKFLKEGQEAQWCIFDSIVSCIYGLKARDTTASVDERKEAKEMQVKFFNRAVGQITGKDCRFGPWLCPESYYMEKGKYVVNDVCPLLWTQADLICAMTEMIKTAESGI
ncbi:hypothetical protein HK104_010824 [Borealophlyctis nickersoniae]|nr:hypothetical protein HK104_010824 [Borealophlyctis nickersoniae]